MQPIEWDFSPSFPASLSKLGRDNVDEAALQETLTKAAYVKRNH